MKVFSKFGPVRRLFIKREPKMAYVDFYLASSASKAVKAFPAHHPLLVDGRELEVKMLNYENKKAFVTYKESVSMANLFLGSAGWSSQITVLESIEPVDEEAREALQQTDKHPGSRLFAETAGNGACAKKGSGYHSHFYAQVVVSIPMAGVKSTGGGYGYAGMFEPEDAISCARNAAVSEACRAALEAVYLVIIDGQCRWAAAAPPKEKCETALVWRLSEPKPDLSSMPCHAVEVEDDNSGVVSLSGG